jgi:hypothetical protein
VNACFCGSANVRLYGVGYRCGDHTPAKLAGLPEPDSERYCAPLRCYCGECPSYVPDTPYRDGETIVDIRAVASGKRRSSLTEYRNAQANTGGAA